MSLPSKLTSYFSAGRPVIAAVSQDGACARELASTGGAGLRVEPARPEALAAAVRAMRDDEDGRRRMGQAGAAYAETVLSRQAAARAVLTFVDELLGR